jgi:hypothetical protein
LIAPSIHPSVLITPPIYLAPTQKSLGEIRSVGDEALNAKWSNPELHPATQEIMRRVVTIPKHASLSKDSTEVIIKLLAFEAFVELAAGTDDVVMVAVAGTCGRGATLVTLAAIAGAAVAVASAETV